MRILACAKRYGRRTVLSLPGLELPEGQITAVLGPNGSGKSTLARLLAGCETGEGPSPLPPGTRVGYMPQKSFAFRLSTEKNILLGGGDPARAAELMRAMGIEDLARQSAKRLSGGETAKMALCRLLMGSYELLVLDEPTAAMDMESTLQAEKLLRAASAAGNCAVLLITHSVRQARRVADRVLILHQGTLVEQGETSRVLTDPREEQTRRFLDFYGE